jgi:hypothetical protein
MMPTFIPPPRSTAVRAAKASWENRRYEEALAKTVEKYMKRIRREEIGGEDDAKKGD